MSIFRSPCAAGLALLIGATSARATVVRDASIEELAVGSPVVVRATVVAQQSRWDDAGRRIETFTELLTTEVLKGEVGAAILVRQPGGVVGDIGAHVAGAARFELGEEVVLFLETPPDDATVFIVRGLASGKVRLSTNALGEVRATRDLRGLAFVSADGRAEPRVRDVRPLEDLGTAEVFLRRIRAALRTTNGGSR